jgi:hypothetical protein
MMRVRLWTLVAAIPFVIGAGSSSASGAAVCSNTAKVLRTACADDTSDNYNVAVAGCMNITDPAAQNSCLDDASAARDDDKSSCGDVYDARLAVCDAIGEAAYDPDFTPENFVDPRDIGRSVDPNPYFPLNPGYQWTYKTSYTNEDGDEITELDTTTVTKDTKLINGVTCVVITDVVVVSDGTIEDTQDWYAQDLTGNVWYCGEISQQKETFEGDMPPNPELVDIEGSWKTGRDQGKPGILMFASPEVGKTYRQELLWADAEDMATILAVDTDEPQPNVNGGTFTCNGECVETRDFSALEPDADEHKYYKKGVGLMLEVDLIDNARNELVSFKHPHP